MNMNCKKTGMSFFLVFFLFLSELVHAQKATWIWYPGDKEKSIVQKAHEGSYSFVPYSG